MKKTLAILLSLALVICMIPSAALAATVTLADGDVTLSQSIFTYDGTEKKPEVTVFADGRTLTEGTDYSISYSNNISAGDPGSASVTVTALGSYFGGTVTKVFTINKLSLDSEMTSLSQNGPVIYNGSDQMPAITVKSGNNTIASDNYDVVWKKENDNKQLSELVNAGKYIATISGKTNCTGTVTKTFIINQFDMNRVSFSLDKQVGELPESVSSLSGLHYYIDGVEATSSLRTFLENNITVAYNGDKTGLTFTFKGTDTYDNFVNETSLSNKSISIETATSIGDTNRLEYRTSSNVAMSDQNINGGTYDGYARDVKNLFKIYDKTTGKYLVLDTDYIVSCADTKNAGSHPVTITGRGKYASTHTLYLNIARRDAAKVSIAAIGKQSSSTAQNVMPVVTDYIGGKTVTLVAGTDYTVSAMQDTSTSNKKQKTLTFDILNGNYTGTRTVQYEVVAPEYDVVRFGYTVTPVSYAPTYNGKVQTPSIAIYTDWRKTTSVSPSYYTISYRYTDRNGKAASTTAPKDANTYKIYVEGRSPYAGELEIGTLTIKPYDFKDIKVTATQASTTSVPTVKVTSYFGDITFVKDTDYTVSTYGSSYGGKGYVYIASDGKGNLTSGTTTASYTVAAKSLYSCTASFTDGRSSASYTGSAIKPAITVRDGYYTTLKEGTDYTVSYKNSAGKVVTSMKDAGTYTIVLTGMGNYSGELTMTFTIIGTDISGYTVTLKESSVTATGYSQTPVITSVKKSYYYSLSSNDYTVSYQDSTGKTVYSMSAPGTYKVVVTGKNGYSGSTYATFRIVGTPQTVTVNQDSYKVYPTSDSFKITAKATGDGTGFTYTSSNPAVASVSSTGVVTMHKVGKAVITVATTGNKKSEPASKAVTVKVYPKKTVQAKKPWTDGKKAQLKVRWNYQDGATKYQIRYSRDKNFKAGTYLTKTVKAHGKDYTTQSTTLTKLKSGYTYYVKVRAVYTDPVTGDNYYGSWSGWRSAKTI